MVDNIVIDSELQMVIIIMVLYALSFILGALSAMIYYKDKIDTLSDYYCEKEIEQINTLTMYQNKIDSLEQQLKNKETRN